jgi:ATP-dependent Lon protease
MGQKKKRNSDIEINADFEMTEEEQLNLPLVPLRDIVIFPYMIVPLFIGRGKSIKALEEAMMSDRRIVVVAQKIANVDDPDVEDIYDVGCVCEVLNMVKLPDGTIKVLIEGARRVQILEYLITDSYFAVKVNQLEENTSKNIETEALMRNVLSKFDKYVRLTRTLPPEAYTSATSIEEPGRLADLITSQLVLKVGEKQRVLQADEPEVRLLNLIEILDHELELLDIQKRIQSQVKKQIEKTQKEYYLKEQLKAIHKELGEQDEKTEEIQEIKDRMKKAKPPKVAKEKLESELKRLSKMPFGTAEAVVVRNYIDWILSLPWAKRTKENLNVAKVRQVLDEDHYSLEKVKQRIVEHLAVQQLKKEKTQGVILCLVGPPGVGKTSLGKSIARALDRKYVRASLGGVRDEAEIRGHRRTYIGSLPGRILQAMKKAGVKNPLFLLDEVDKMSTDFRGDPSSALLEVLDPEMNHEFSDHYLEIPFDLSEVMFITTANLTQPIPAPLLDRMEVIHIPGYTEEEKMQIAKGFLIPKAWEKNGIREGQLSIGDEALLEVVRRYTREAGVRNLEREINKICRKQALIIVEQKEKKQKITKSTITRNNITTYLGQPKYRYGLMGEEDEIGCATGLAWTSAGGEILSIEVTLMPGKGSLRLTGQLGDVMKESAQAALSYARTHCDDFGLKKDFYETLEVHLHVPEGAVPKDGPSAGVALASALISGLTKIPVKRTVAMSGEVTLRGKVLPVGGIKEKVLAAHRAGILTIVMPKENEKDYNEISSKVRSHLKTVFVETIDEVLAEALTKPPWKTPPPVASAGKKAAAKKSG